MSYEENIPEYALVPAKNPNEYEMIQVSKSVEEEPKVREVVKKEPVLEEGHETQGEYSQIKITSVWKEESHRITIEEDVLVPDIKPDLKDILLMDGVAQLTETKTLDKGNKDISVEVKGDIQLQVIYKPEENQDRKPIISIGTRIPFQSQWRQNQCSKENLEVTAVIEEIDYLVVNERKFRVKLQLEISAKQYEEKTIEAFEGIKGEPVQLRKKKIEFTDVALRKREKMTVEEYIPYKETGKEIKEILKEDIWAVQGYKQITGEKVVVNGFIHCNLLLLTLDEETNCEEIEQFLGKTEFTQFVPVNQSGPWSGSNMAFDCSRLSVMLVKNQEDKSELQIKGEITTSVELYKNLEQDMVYDAYHMEKELKYDCKYAPCKTLIGNGISEISSREIINNPHTNEELSKVVYAQGKPRVVKGTVEQGKVIVSGEIEGRILFLEAGGKESPQEALEKEPEMLGELGAIKVIVPFKTYIDVPGCKEGDLVKATIGIKEIWAEKINNNQIEYNCTALAAVQVMAGSQIAVLSNPRMSEDKKGHGGRIVVYIAKEDDDLWSIAKRYKTTMEAIAGVNNVDESGLLPGKKLLIVRRKV